MILSFIGAKGGTLKTASTLSLGALFALRGHRVAIADCDPQHSATRALPMRVFPDGSQSMTEVKHGGVAEPLRAPAVEVALPSCTLRLLRGGRTLIRATEPQVRQHLQRAATGTDLLLVDTLPAVGAITLAAMSQSDLVIIPVEASADAIDALPDVLASAEEVVPSGCQIRLLLTKADIRERITYDVAVALAEEYPGLLYRTWIPTDVRAKEAAGYMRPVAIYAPSCRAARAYVALAVEVHRDLGLPEVR